MQILYFKFHGMVQDKKELAEKFFELVEKIRKEDRFYQEDIQIPEGENKLSEFMGSQNEAERIKNIFEQKQHNFQNKDTETLFFLEKMNEDLRDILGVEEDVIGFPQVQCGYEISVNFLRLLGSLKKKKKSEMGKDELESFMAEKSREFQEKIISYLEDNGIAEDYETVQDKKGNISFLNFNLSEKFVQKTLDYILKVINDEVVLGNIRNKNTIIDYSSPNIGKQMTIGHLRTTILGEVFKNLFERKGKAPVAGFNHLGDWGEQFGKIFFVLLYSSEEKLKEFQDQFFANPNTALFEIYVHYKELKEEYSDPRKTIKQLNSLLTNADDDLFQLWSIVKSISITDFEKVYERLGIEFESRLGESFYEVFIDEVLTDLGKAGFLHRDEEGQKVFFQETGKKQYKLLKSEEIADYDENEFEENGIFQKVLKNQNGVTNYLTRDLASLKFRAIYVGGDFMVYITGEEQTVHFSLLEKLGKSLDYIGEGAFEHFYCGLYLRNGKKLSSRDGGVLKLSDVLDEVDSHLDNEVLANAAVIVNDLKQHMQKDVEFDASAITNPFGDTGVYLLYTAVRWRKILEEAGYEFDIHDFDKSVLSDDYRELIGILYKYRDVLRNAVNSHQLNTIGSYAFEVAHKLSSLYSSGENVSRIQDEKKKKAILSLIYISYKILKDIFSLMNIQIPSRIENR